MPNLLFRPHIFLKVTVFLLLSSFIASFFSCRSHQTPDVSNFKADIHIQRFEHDLFEIDTNNYMQELNALEQKYPAFFGLFVSQIMNFGEPSDTTKIYADLLKFIQNPDMRYLYDTCTAAYPNLNDIEKELSKSMQYVQYYLPRHQVPEVISHISAFGPAAVTINDELIGINLDMYMGSDFPPYDTPDFPKYLTRRFRHEYIVPNCLKAYIKGIYAMNEREMPHLLDQMIYEGKLLYFLDITLPDAPDSLKMGYRQKDLDWCTKNEPEIWAYLLEQELLYNTQSKNFYRYLEEAPTTSGMPSDSPGRVTIWIGWQIVRHFMKENPQTSFEELMAIKDGQLLLKRGKYKPKR